MALTFIEDLWLLLLARARVDRQHEAHDDLGEDLREVLEEVFCVTARVRL